MYEVKSLTAKTPSSSGCFSATTATFAIIGFAHFIAGRFDEAVPKILLAIQETPSGPNAYRYLAACYAHIGRLAEARETIKRLRDIPAVVITDPSYLRNPEHRELLLSGLRLAMAETA